MKKLLLAGAATVLLLPAMALAQDAGRAIPFTKKGAMVAPPGSCSAAP